MYIETTAYFTHSTDNKVKLCSVSEHYIVNEYKCIIFLFIGKQIYVFFSFGNNLVFNIWRIKLLEKKGAYYNSLQRTYLIYDLCKHCSFLTLYKIKINCNQTFIINEEVLIKLSCSLNMLLTFII